MISHYYRAVLIAGCNLLMKLPLGRQRFLDLLILKQDFKYAQECALKRYVLKAME